ncbi:hypothetical protein FB45DRAFT_757490, partial [Roridomyces roridus]
RFQCAVTPADLDEAVELGRAALVHCATEDMGTYLRDLANILQLRSAHLGHAHDIDEAIELHRKVILKLDSTTGETQTTLNELGRALVIRFNQRASPRDLDESVDLHRQALHSDTESHNTFLNYLADVLQIRFQEFGRKSDIDEAIALYEEAIRTRSRRNQNRSVVVHNLAYALLRRSRRQCGGCLHLCVQCSAIL